MHNTHMATLQTEWLNARKKELRLSDDAIGKAVGRDRSIPNKLINGSLPFDVKYVDGLASVFKISQLEVLYRFGVLDAMPGPGAPAGPVITLAVQFPSEDALSEMFQGMLQTAGQPEIADALAPQLAQLLPNALARAQAREPLHRTDADARGDAESPRPRAKGRPAPQQQQNT